MNTAYKKVEVYFFNGTYITVKKNKLQLPS